MMQMQSQQAMLGSVSGIPFGGMNGVPPPPPPRSSSSAEISIPSVSQTVSSGERAIRREKPKVEMYLYILINFEWLCITYSCRCDNWSWIL
jgi:hypothetical protein